MNSPAEHPNYARSAPIGAGRPLAWLVTVTGGLGLLASSVLTWDRLRLESDPGFRPACDIGSVLSCTDVMRSDQASAFGVHNTTLGLVAYAVVVVVGVALVTGARLPRWAWAALNAGAFAGAVFCMWLMGQSLYVLGALCLWCCVTWAATIALFWYTTLFSIGHGVLRAPRRLAAPLREFHWAVPALWYAAVAGLIAGRFAEQWQAVLF
ncbi:vitamin K epoxide reductase family protein [Streptomyces gamaensis]|uniref:Vitamin K epoxide reductase family protein n=1 Tax=Streptomyces gamaensis TaxID=1763542 RepID=A0ABW0YYJ9_9ACTN